MVRHKWQDRDDLLIVYIFRCLNRQGDVKACPHNICDKASSIIGAPPGSVGLRYRNVLHLATDGREGAPHYAALTKLIWQRRKDTPVAEIERILASEFSAGNLSAIKKLLSAAHQRS